MLCHSYQHTVVMIKNKATPFSSCKFIFWEDDTYYCRETFLETGYRVSVLEPKQKIQSQAATAQVSGKKLAMLFGPTSSLEFHLVLLIDQ